jgi:hypothetical protein
VVLKEKLLATLMQVSILTLGMSWLKLLNLRVAVHAEQDAIQNLVDLGGCSI